MDRNIFIEFFTNKIFLTAGASWFLAQVIKTAINYHFTRKIDFERMVGSGGMPSCHSATVCALATVSGIAYGFNSFQFALAAIVAIIVMYDARGVRRETGKQAVIIKEIMEYLSNPADAPAPEFSDENLKELVGHTPLQVAVGAVFGTVIGVLSGLLWVGYIG